MDARDKATGRRGLWWSHHECVQLFEEKHEHNKSRIQRSVKKKKVSATSRDRKYRIYNKKVPRDGVNSTSVAADEQREQRPNHCKVIPDWTIPKAEHSFTGSPRRRGERNIWNNGQFFPPNWVRTVFPHIQQPKSITNKINAHTQQSKAHHNKIAVSQRKRNFSLFGETHR